MWAQIQTKNLTSEDICEVQAGSTHANNNLISAWGRIGLLLDLEHIDVARSSRYYLSHRPISTFADSMKPQTNGSLDIMVHRKHSQSTEIL